MALLLTVLVASLAGSLHCAGMCGPLVAFAVGDTQKRSHAFRALLQTGYHGGRGLGYAALGAACGMVGAALNFGGAMVGLSRLAAMLAGGMMIVAGLIAVLHYAGVRLPAKSTPSLLQRMVVAGQRAALGLHPLARSLTIGLLTTLLPCGWLYYFALLAAGTGSAWFGAAVMLAFWVGTVPVLAGVGIGVQTLTGTIGRRVPLVTAVVIVILGLVTLSGRMQIPLDKFNGTVRSASGADMIEHVESLPNERPPCCQHHGQTPPADEQ